MYIGGLDVGTTGCKLTLYNEDGGFVHNEYREYDVSRKGGEHEMDAGDVFDSVLEVIKVTAEKYSGIGIIGVTTFGEAFVMLGEDDKPLLPTMLYTDPRGEDEVKELCDKVGEERIISITGVKPHQMYSLPKVMWIKKNRPEIYKKAKCVLLMEDYIVYMLTGKRQIDYSLAARTMALDIRNRCWSKEVFDAAGVDVPLMSEPVPSGNIAGTAKPELGIGNIKIMNGSHDQVAAAVGAGVSEPGNATDGTGTVECITPVFDSIPDNEELYRSGYAVVPYVFDGTYVCYAFSYTGGAVIKWYRDNFAKHETGNVYAKLDSSIPDEPTGILVMPHFAGAATPYMDNNSKAAIIGLTLEHTDAHFYKALMEGVTYEIMVNIDRLESAGINPDRLFATGGGAQSEVWLQIKADIIGKPITALDAGEAGTCGTCMLAAVASGVCKDLKEAKSKFVKEKKTYYPDMAKNEIYKKYFEAYKGIYDAVRGLC